MSSYRLVPTAPQLEQYITLRASAGLSLKDPDQAAGAIGGSWAFCHIQDENGIPVAMGRVIGDGGWYYHIADIATHPDHQRQGLGEQVMNWLINEIRTRSKGEPYITLVASPAGQPLYRKLGFNTTEPNISMLLE